MMRSALLLASALAVAPLGAQTTRPPAIPDSPAGRVLRVWLEANNSGGSPEMVPYLSSYLFDRRMHLDDLWTRRTAKTDEFWTRDSVPGRRFGGEKPVYVLTSGQTFSAAEEFAYNLQSQKRATIVGEATAGGAHPCGGAGLATSSSSECRAPGPSIRSRARTGKAQA